MSDMRKHVVKLEQLLREKKWDEAVTYGMNKWMTGIMRDALKYVAPRPHELIVTNTASSWCLLGLMHSICRNDDVMRDEREAYRCFCRATELGHPYALYQKGCALLTGKGVARDFDAGLECLMRAADAGVDLANFWCGRELRKRHRYLEAAQYYLGYSEQHFVRDIVWNHPKECCPFGLWTSSVPLQQLVLPRVRLEQRIWMLVAKRLQIDRNVALIIASYICTV